MLQEKECAYKLTRFSKNIKTCILYYLQQFYIGCKYYTLKKRGQAVVQ